MSRPPFEIAHEIRTADSSELENLCIEMMALGPRAIEAIVSELAKGSLPHSGVLGDLLEAQRDPGALPYLIEALEHDGDHRLPTIRALGHHRSAAASEALIEYIANLPDAWHTLRSVAIDALGRTRNEMARHTLEELGRCLLPDSSPRAIEELCQTVDHEEQFGRLRVLLAVSVALSKNGGDRLHSLPAAVLAHPCENPGFDALVRERAAEALRHIPPTDLEAPLIDLRSDPNPEVRRHLANVLYLWGIPEVVPALIDLCDDEDDPCSQKAPCYLWWMLEPGPAEERSSDHWRGFWEARSSEFPPGVPLRAGKPLNIGLLIRQLEIPERRTRLLQELEILTGEDFERLPFIPLEEQHTLARRAHAWWQEHRSAYEPGRIYRYGRAV